MSCSLKYNSKLKLSCMENECVYWYLSSCLYHILSRFPSYSDKFSRFYYNTTSVARKLSRNFFFFILRLLVKPQRLKWIFLCILKSILKLVVFYHPLDLTFFLSRPNYLFRQCKSLFRTRIQVRLILPVPLPVSFMKSF